jgi:hypothetical protein
MRGCGAAIWLVTLGRQAEDLSEPRRILVRLFLVAFASLVVIFAVPVFAQGT